MDAFAQHFGTLTDALVTSPAKTRVMPKAMTIGHAVDAGSLIVRGVRSVPDDRSMLSDAIFLSLIAQ